MTTNQLNSKLLYTIGGMHENGHNTWRLEYVLNYYPNHRFGITIRHIDADNTTDQTVGTGPFAANKTATIKLINWLHDSMVFPRHLHDVISDCWDNALLIPTDEDCVPQMH